METMLYNKIANFININKYIIKVTKMLGLDKKNESQQISIMNIFINIVTETLKKTFWTFTGNMGLLERVRPIINMKSEFIYKRILLTKNKKNYSGIIIAELGKLLDNPQMDTKGLAAIKKSNVPKKLRSKFAEILRHDILEAEHIDIKNILKKYDAIGEDISNSLQNGLTEYTLPKNVELTETYKTPDQIEPIRACIIWNAIEPEHQIVPPEKINMIKLKNLDNDSPEMLKFKEEHPDKYAAIMKVVYNEGVANPTLDISRFGFTCCAIPKSVEKIPDYLIPLIDIDEMITKNVSNGYIILESLGIYISEHAATQYKSNIIRL